MHGLAELLRAGWELLRHAAEGLLCGGEGNAPALDDGLRVDLGVEKLLGFADKLAGENADAGSAVAYLFVGGLADVNENAGRGVVN